MNDEQRAKDDEAFIQQITEKLYMDTVIKPFMSRCDVEDVKDPIMKFFDYDVNLNNTEIHGHYFDAAQWIVARVPRNAERTVALRKLLESRDCALRAALP